MCRAVFKKDLNLLEVQWGKPMTFIVSQDGDAQTFTTPEQARYWLQRKWPVTDGARLRALRQVEAAMDCVASIGSARRAFLAAAKSAGFSPDTLMT